MTHTVRAPARSTMPFAIDEIPSTTARAGLAFETELWRTGYRHVAGADEAGRGAWAGPVVAAAVILPASARSLQPLLGAVDDSKKLAPRTRERLFDLIHAHAEAIGVGSASAEEIDSVGIAQANRLALDAGDRSFEGSARLRACRLLHSAAASASAAWGAPRRRALFDDRRRIDHRQGHPGPAGWLTRMIVMPATTSLDIKDMERLCTEPRWRT